MTKIVTFDTGETVHTVEEISAAAVKDVARKMLVAAQTAPKGRGENNTFICIIEDEEISQLADEMHRIGLEENVPGFVRDAENIRSCPAMLLIGTRIRALRHKKCSMCGFANCMEKEKHVDVPCVFNTTDLGIAIGSAVSVAMDNRIDNRIMYSAGYVACLSGLLPTYVRMAYGIPLSATSKNPFFDRK